MNNSFKTNFVHRGLIFLDVTAQIPVCQQIGLSMKKNLLLCPYISSSCLGNGFAFILKVKDNLWRFPVIYFVLYQNVKTG